MLTAQVVLPTFLFWLAIAITLVIAALLTDGLNVSQCDVARASMG